ncbi:MAG: hypothetical protein V1743_01830 [Nanoarchaeota archaeon]
MSIKMDEANKKEAKEAQKTGAHIPQEHSLQEHSVLKRNVNLFLLVLLMIILLLGVGYAVLYQSRLHGITVDIKEASSNLTVCQADLNNTRQNLFSALDRLNSTEKDVKTYDVIYEQKESELEKTQTDLADTKDELGSTKVALDRSEKAFAAEHVRAVDLDQKYTAAQSTIATLNQKVTNYKAEVSCLYATADADETETC